jgi:general stress protein 26
MVKIPEDVKKMIRNQQIIVVGSTDEAGLCNVSPRTAFTMPENEVFWIELFKHKSFHNFQKNKMISIAVYDTKKIDGFQLKGSVALVRDKKKKKDIATKIIDKLTRLNKDRILQQMKKYDYNVMKFTPKIIYSLNPNDFADIPIVLDSDVSLGQLAGGVDPKSRFGISKQTLANLKK